MVPNIEKIVNGAMKEHVGRYQVYGRNGARTKSVPSADLEALIASLKIHQND